MTILIASLVAVALAIGAAALFAWRATPVRHDPMEYYRGWGGYWHPIGLQHRITKDEAEALHAQGNAYLVGYFDRDGKLTRVIKMYRGAVFFDFAYAYHTNGRLKNARVSRDGRETMLDYDERGRRLSPGSAAF